MLPDCITLSSTDHDINKPQLKTKIEYSNVSTMLSYTIASGDLSFAIL